MSPEYKDRVVAFIDIIGFRGLVERLSREPADIKLHERLHTALESIHDYQDPEERIGTGTRKPEVSVFSDSIVISAEPRDTNLVLWNTIHLQCALLAMGILVRGGVAAGRTVHANGILYGEGMIKAYDLESKTACYPRVVLEPVISDTLIQEPLRAKLCRRDIDGFWFIDPFALGHFQEVIVAALLEEPSPELHRSVLARIGTTIDRELAGQTEPGHVAKWRWMKSQHVLATEELARTGSPRAWYPLSQTRCH